MAKSAEDPVVLPLAERTTARCNERGDDVARNADAGVAYDSAKRALTNGRQNAKKALRLLLHRSAHMLSKTVLRAVCAPPEKTQEMRKATTRGNSATRWDQQIVRLLIGLAAIDASSVAGAAPTPPHDELLLETQSSASISDSCIDYVCYTKYAHSFSFPPIYAWPSSFSPTCKPKFIPSYAYPILLNLVFRLLCR